MDLVRLKTALDRFLQSYDIKKRIANDPVSFVHRFQDPRDQEIAGLIASALAYGRVEKILHSVDRVLWAMGWEPYKFVAEYRPAKDGKWFEGVVHRFNRGKDVAALVCGLQQVLEKHGSLGAYFGKDYHEEEENIKGPLVHFVEGFLALDYSPIYGKGGLPDKAGLRFLFPSPLRGSSCKRLNLYLRWMVRPNDGLDLGIWKGIFPSKLVIPLDTHVARISQHIGLTRLRTPNWRMAEDVTRSLRRLDPLDPIKYDFALCHLGISGQCPRRRDLEKCIDCQIWEICCLEEYEA